MKLDVVVPIYNEQDNLPELQSRLTDALGRVSDCQWRVIYVNDGSKDESVAMIASQHQADNRFHLIELSRNFGHQPAISAGLQYATGDAVVVMDGDLQDPPEIIPDLVEAWRDGGEVILARRRSRQDSGLRSYGFLAFHAFFRWISDFPMPPNTGVFGLLDRRAADQLNTLTEQNRFLPGMRSWIGFDQREVLYDRQARAAGEPKQSLRRLFAYALNGVFSFSYKPLRLMTCTGIMISFVGFLIAIVFIVRRLLGVDPAVTGFTTLVTLLLFLGGFQLVAMGLLGEYIGRIYDEVKRRPLFIVRQTLGFQGEDAKPDQHRGRDV